MSIFTLSASQRVNSGTCRTLIVTAPNTLQAAGDLWYIHLALNLHYHYMCVYLSLHDLVCRALLLFFFCVQSAHFNKIFKHFK